MFIIYISIGCLIGLIKVIYELTENSYDKRVMRIYRQKVIESNNARAMQQFKEESPPEIDYALEDRRENYDNQIEGYTQLIKLLDRAYKTETDEKKKAALLSKQLNTLEKLNKTLEKRKKLDYL